MQENFKGENEMTFEEKLAAQGRKLDELKAKLDEGVAAAKAAREMRRDEFVADVKELDAALEELDAKVDAKVQAKAAEIDAHLTLDKAAAEYIANTSTRIDRVQEGTAEQVSNAKAHAAAVENNVELVKERRDEKRNSVKLHAQMSVENAKAKVDAHKKAVDKAAMEAYIIDVLDYAECCEELAFAWALEAEYAVNDALEVIDEYNAKYGKEA